MAIILIDAKTITVPDERSLYTLCDNSKYNVDYIPYDRGFEGNSTTAKIGEQIKLNRIIQRNKREIVDAHNIDYYKENKEWRIQSTDHNGVVYAENYQDSVIGLSKDVHDVLGWSVDYVSDLECEVTSLRHTVERVRRYKNKLVIDNSKIQDELNTLQNLSLWSRIVRVFKRY